MKTPPLLTLRLEFLAESIQNAVALYDKDIEDSIAEQLEKTIKEFDFKELAQKLINEAIEYQIKATIDEKIKDVINNAVSDALYNTGNYDTLKSKIAKEMREVIKTKFK